MSLPAIPPHLIVQSVDGELLVYDPGTTQVHRLAPIAARVFEACRRGASPEEAAAALGLPHAEELVRTAVAELHTAGLTGAPESEAPPLGRRQALAIWGKAAMVPLVLTLAVPLPAAAQSVCVPNCVVNCDGTNLCSPATPNPAPDALCSTTFCGQQRTIAGATCATDTFVTFGCFTESGGTIQRDCAAARAVAAGGGVGTPYACCENCT